MTISHFSIFDDFMDDPEGHVDRIIRKGFQNVDTNIGLFKGIHALDGDIVQKKVEAFFPFHTVAMNFARLSPLDQEEPTFIHSDAGMGDLTCVLYLSKTHPKEDGTTIYNSENEDDKSVVIHAKFNRMIVFDSALFHSRNIFCNFGSGDAGRLIQVLFLKRK